jgi:hypothetical protein
MTMLKIIAAGVAVLSASGLAQNNPRSLTLDSLTVPQHRLPPACRSAPAPSESIGSNRIRGGLWSGLPISTNPWTGTDRRLIATIRERIDPPLTPDGPPLSGQEAARYSLQLADGIDEGYAAFYTQSDSEHIAVYALRFRDGGRNGDPLTTSRRFYPTRIELGRIVAWVSGSVGPCLQAVEAHVRSLRP